MGVNQKAENVVHWSDRKARRSLGGGDMTNRIMMALCVVAALGAVVQAVPTSYSGSLTTADGGLVGVGGWDAAPNPVTFSWTVTQNPDQSWHYHYEFDSTDVQGEISHLQIRLKNNRGIRLEGYEGMGELKSALAGLLPSAHVDDAGASD